MRHINGVLYKSMFSSDRFAFRIRFYRIVVDAIGFFPNLDSILPIMRCKFQQAFRTAFVSFEFQCATTFESHRSTIEFFWIESGFKKARWFSGMSKCPFRCPNPPQPARPVGPGDIKKGVIGCPVGEAGRSIYLWVSLRNKVWGM
jgi:hypothetical protein